MVKKGHRNILMPTFSKKNIICIEALSDKNELNFGHLDFFFPLLNA